MSLNLALLIILFVVLLCLGMPVAFVIGISGMAFFAATPELPFSIVVQRIVAQTQSYSFLAVPFFIFAGGLMNESGITTRILSFAQCITRRMWGGTAQISVVMSTMMGGVSGSATADAAMETRLLAPEMLRRGYSKGYIISVNSLTAMITATIPPSLGLIIYGFVGDVSIGRLFVAGIIPGILMMAFLMATTAITCRRKKYDPPKADAPKLTAKEFFVNLKNSVWALLFPIILIVGIRVGICTPSEAGAFCIVYAVFIGVFVYRELTWKSFVSALRTALADTAAVMLLITFSGPFSYAVTYVKLPQKLAALITGITTQPQLMMIIILIWLFILGMFLDSNVNFLLLTPMFLPMVQQAGFDPVHFGVLMATIVTMGVFTPPVGSAIYPVCSIIDCPVDEFTKEALPFFLAIFLEMLLLVFLPDVVMFLPKLIYGY